MSLKILLLSIQDNHSSLFISLMSFDFCFILLYKCYSPYEKENGYSLTTKTAYSSQTMIQRSKQRAKFLPTWSLSIPYHFLCPLLLTNCFNLLEKSNISIKPSISLMTWHFKSLSQDISSPSIFLWKQSMFSQKRHFYTTPWSLLLYSFSLLQSLRFFYFLSLLTLFQIP